MVRFEELVISGILQFGEIDQFDVELLKEWLKDRFDIEVSNGRIFYNSEYIDCSFAGDLKEPWLANKYFLNSDYSFDTNVSKDNGNLALKKRLEFARGATLSKAFESFNSDLFILRKIKKLPALSQEDLSICFGKEQLEIINNLQKQGYINYYSNTDTMMPMHGQLYITRLGEAKLFIDNYKKEIEEVCKQYELKIDLNLLEKYLSKKDLTMDIEELLNLETFNNCCFICDNPIQGETIKLPSYKKAEKGWKNSKTSLIHELLTIPKGNTIYFCHPNDLLKERMDLNINDVNIPWADIDVDAMEKYYDYRKFSFSESRNALDYVICVLNGKTHYKKHTKFRYLTVMEKDSEGRCLVRGIIKSDDNGFYVLLNPLFEKYLDSIKKPDEAPETEIIKEYKP